MPDSSWRWYVLALTILALVAFVAAVRNVVRAREWSMGSTLFFGMALLSTSLIEILITYSDGWTSAHDPFGNTTLHAPAWALLLQRAFTASVLLGAATLFLVRVVKPAARFNVPASLFLLTAVISGISALAHHDNPLQRGYGVFLAIMIATTVAPRGLGIHVGLGAFCLLVALTSGAAALLFPEFSFLPCGQNKCGVLGTLFRGVFENENGLAVYLALSLPFIYIGFGRRYGPWLAGYALFIVVLTGGRTGAVAAVVTFVILLVVRPDIRQPRVSLGSAALIGMVLLVTAVIGLVLPFTAQNPNAFTGRVNLWVLARGELGHGSNIVFGTGSQGWNHVREAGLIDFSAVYSVHNQWLQVLFTTGAVGLVIVIIALTLLIVHAGRQYFTVIGCVLVPVFCLAIAERPWSLDGFDWIIWALPAALLSYPASSGTAQERALAPQPSSQSRAPIQDGGDETDVAPAPGHFRAS